VAVLLLGKANLYTMKPRIPTTNKLPAMMPKIAPLLNFCSEGSTLGVGVGGVGLVGMIGEITVLL